MGVRIALVVADVVAEDAAMALGTAATIALGSAGAICSGVGAIVLLGCIVYQNRDAIAALLKKESMPGPERACRAYLAMVNASRVYAVGPAAVRSAGEAASTALDDPQTFFVNYALSPATKDELKAAGLSDQDLGVIGTIAPLSADSLLRMPDPTQ
jgi:hypothetical protein